MRNLKLWLLQDGHRQSPGRLISPQDRSGHFKYAFTSSPPRLLPLPLPLDHSTRRVAFTGARLPSPKTRTVFKPVYQRLFTIVKFRVAVQYVF
eukprot:m.141006 g.141006  ORF g.141006 m.141006 type:complete len:93 (+) comp14048_c0_seq2:740-1018(+)